MGRIYREARLPRGPPIRRPTRDPLAEPDPAALRGVEALDRAPTAGATRRRGTLIDEAAGLQGARRNSDATVQRRTRQLESPFDVFQSAGDELKGRPGDRSDWN
jgi:hypothetical protein